MSDNNKQAIRGVIHEPTIDYYKGGITVKPRPYQDGGNGNKNGGNKPGEKSESKPLARVGEK